MHSLFDTERKYVLFCSYFKKIFVMIWNILFITFSSLEDICLCKFFHGKWVRKSRNLGFLYDLFVIRLHTIFLSVVSVASVSQVFVCFTCVILQTKSEENTEARESDMDFEGVFNHANSTEFHCLRKWFATLRPT